MAFIQPEELQHMRIDRMIFHVVGPAQGDLIKLDEIEPGKHESFFLDRVRSVAKGNLFDFIDQSGTWLKLQSVVANETEFVHQSRLLAEAFHGGHGGNTKKGVFLVLSLRLPSERLFSLIKYDHENVLFYQLQQRNGHRRAVMDEIANTFVKSREALQKAAIIRLTSTGGELCVVDRSTPHGIAHYFRTFLGVKRRFGPEQLTARVARVAEQTGREHADTLPAHVTKSLTARIYDAIQSQGSFSADDPVPFLTAVFGPLSSDSPVRRTFSKCLRSEQIEDESFDFAPEAIKRPRKRQKVTREGIQIIYEESEGNRIEESRDHAGEVVITIRTSGVIRDDYYSERNSRSR